MQMLYFCSECLSFLRRRVSRNCLNNLVIPAEAGIQLLRSFPILDPHFRGDDRLVCNITFRDTRLRGDDKLVRNTAIILRNISFYFGLE